MDDNFGEWVINFPYSTCISSFFGGSIPTSLFILNMFFRSCLCYFCILYSKGYLKNIRDRSKKSRSREYNYLIISIILRTSNMRRRHARASLVTFTCEVPNDVKLTLPADSGQNGVVEVSLLHF